MTLSPIDNRNVRGVAAERYPINLICAHPECNELAVDPHHIWRRSAIGNDSWFVAIENDVQKLELPIPHVVGLCRAHHDLVTNDEAWIKLEDGVFVWYDHEDPDFPNPPRDEVDAPCHVWKSVGPLDPQPAGREKKNGKPKRRKFQGAERRQRASISIKVPKDAQEDGAGLLTDLVEQLEERLGHDPTRPIYYTLMDALAFTIYNAGPEDF